MRSRLLRPQDDILDIDIPRWALPLTKPATYKLAKGGRASGKSHHFAEQMVARHVRDRTLQSVCLREVQKDLKHSVKSLLAEKIRKFNAGYYFTVQDAVIKSSLDTGIIIFQGMQNHNADSIKSLEGFRIAWFEEAQRASARSLTLLNPTIRAPGAEQWFSWNPEFPTDPIEGLFNDPPENTISVTCSYLDNPWVGEKTLADMRYDRDRDPAKYAWVWLGQYRKNTDSQVFKNWRIEEFDTPPEVALRFGADWGFAVDPTVLVRCYLIGRKLYVDYEAYQVGCEIMDTPDLFLTVPGSEKWPIVADSARPETISHMRKAGFPKIMPAVKGPGSLEDGVEFLKSFEIIVHPRCVHTIDELSLYSYKIDEQTQQVLPILADKHNHVVDALRYACENVRRVQAGKPTQVVPIPTRNVWSRR